MTVEKYLGQIGRLNVMINQNLIELDGLKDMALSLGNRTDTEKVKASRTDDRLSTAIAKIVDMETEIDNLIDYYVAEKKRIVRQINRIEDRRFYNILYAKYVNDLNYEQIAAGMNYSYKQIKRLHDKALQVFYELFREEIEKCPDMSANV